MSKFTAKDQWKKFTREQRIQIKAPEMLELLKRAHLLMPEEFDDEKEVCKEIESLIKEIEGE